LKYLSIVLLFIVNENLNLLYSFTLGLQFVSVLYNSHFWFYSKIMPETGVSRLVGVKLDEVKEV